MLTHKHIRSLRILKNDSCDITNYNYLKIVGYELIDGEWIEIFSPNIYYRLIINPNGLF